MARSFHTALSPAFAGTTLARQAKGHFGKVLKPLETTLLTQLLPLFPPPFLPSSMCSVTHSRAQSCDQRATTSHRGDHAIAAPKATIVLTRQLILANLGLWATRGHHRLPLFSSAVDMGRILKA